jgi:hypothetical protein
MRDEYARLGSGMVSESGASGWDGGWVFGLVDFVFGRGVVLFGDDVVDGLGHFLSAVFNILCNLFFDFLFPSSCITKKVHFISLNQALLPF